MMKKKAKSKKSRTRLERQRQRKAATVLARQQQPTTTTTTKEHLPAAKEGEDEVASAQARRERATNYLEATQQEQQRKQKQAWIDRRKALQRRGWPWTAVVKLQKPCHNYEDYYDPDLFCFWDVLPVELLVSVMQYLDVKSLLVLEQTCCVARDFLRDNQPLWRYIVHTEFGPPNRLPSDWRMEAIRLSKQWEKVSSGHIGRVTSLLVNQAVTTGMSVKVRSSLLLHRQTEKANKAGTLSLDPMQLFARACKGKDSSGEGSVATVRCLIQHFRQYISQEMQRSPSFVFPLFRCVVNLDDVALLDTLKLEFGNLINSFVPPVVSSNTYDFDYWMDDDPFTKAVKHSCKRAAWWLWNNEKLLHASTEVRRLAAYLPVTASSGDYELFRAVLHRLEVSVIKPEHFVEGDGDEWIQKHEIALPDELYQKWNAALIAASQGGSKMKTFTEVRSWITGEYIDEEENEEEGEKEVNKEEEVNEAKAPFTSYERIVEHMLFRSFLFDFGRLGRVVTSFAFDSPIEVACWAKQKRIFNMLLSAGNLRAMHHTTQFKALKVVVQRGDVDMMDLLLAAAGPLSPYEMAQIIDLAARKGNAAVLRHLLEKHRPHAIDLARVNPLHTACCFRRPSAVKTLLELGWDPNQSACLTRTPLQCALDGWSQSNGKDNKKHITAVVQLLLQAGAKVNVPYYYTGHTVLSRAADRGYPEVIKLLVEHGADVEEATAPVTSTSSAVIASATRPLVAACLSLHLDCVEVLLQSGANPNRTQGEKKTILQLLAVHGDAALPVVRVLLCHGAEPDHVVKGKKPLLLAILTNEPSDNLVAELLRHGAQTDCLLALPVRLLKEEVQRRRKSRSGEMTTATEVRSEKQPRHNIKKKEKQKLKQQSHNPPKEEWISLLLDYFRSLPVA